METENNNSKETLDIEKIENELKYFYKKRKTFLILGLSFYGLSILLFALFCYVGVVEGAYLVCLSIVAGIVMFVLRGALYNSRIATRKKLLKEYNKEK